MSDEKEDNHLGGIMLGLVEFQGEPGIGIKVGDSIITVFPIQYMVNVYDQLGEILYKVGALDDDESEGESEDDEEMGMLQ